MYQLLNKALFVAGIVLLVLAWRVFQRKAEVAYPWRKVLFTGFGALCLILTLVPFETPYRAKTPEEVFNNISSDRILNTIHGESSCLMVSEDFVGTYKRTYIAMDENGYKIPQIDTSTEVFSTPGGLPSFEVEQVSGTSDYYLFGRGAYSTDALTITDSLGSQFYIINTMSEDGVEYEVTTYIYYAYLESFDENYCITIDGQSFCVGDME